MLEAGSDGFVSTAFVSSMWKYWLDVLSIVGNFKFRLSHPFKNTEWGCLRAGSWGEYLHQTERKQQEAGCNCKIRAVFIFTIHGSKIKDYEVGGACSTHGRDEKHVQNFGREGSMF
jgi:hypothetical protein